MCCFAQGISGESWLMLTQQILNLIQISEQFYSDVPPVRLMDPFLIYPEVHPWNRNELTNRNMVRLKNRQCDSSATFSHRQWFGNFSLCAPSCLKFHLWPSWWVVSTLTSGFCFLVRKSDCIFPLPTYVAFLSSGLHRKGLIWQKECSKKKKKKKAWMHVGTFSPHSRCLILLYECFHYDLMNDKGIVKESPADQYFGKLAWYWERHLQN